MFARKPFPVLLLVILSFLCRTAAAQVSCVPVYLKEYKGAGHIMPNAIKSLPDGTFIVAGKGTLNNTSTYDGMVERITSTGTVIWSYLIGGTGRDEFTGIALLADGTFLLYGSTTSFGFTNDKAWLVKIDNAGSLIWSRQLGNSAGIDRVKAVQQFSDGDIIGTLNTNDSSALSDPVVFKMALDGTLRWAQTFDHGNNDSFTSIAFSGNVIYASGFYTVNTHRAVIVKLNSSDGSLISSVNLYQKDNTVHHEVVGLEIYNNIISYGLWMWKPDPMSSFHLNSIILAQTDMADNTRYALFSSNGGDTLAIYPRRTSDNGFVVLRGYKSGNGPPAIFKVSPYGTMEWGNLLSNFINQQTNNALDITGDGGFISAGFYQPFLSTYTMRLVRMNKQGIIGACWPGYNGMFFDTVTYSQQPFTWAMQTAFSPAVNDVTLPATLTLSSNTPTVLCETPLCTDITPLPPACNKTYHLQYASHRSTIIKDAVTTPDGGKLAIGDQYIDGLLMKINANGDIAWSKQYETFLHITKFMRILRMPDDNYIIFANRRVVYNHYIYQYVSMIKVDIAGNIIWTRDINYKMNSTDMSDVFQTPDGGFVLIMNANYGFPPLYNYVIRYDGNANLLWKKEMKHSNTGPVYKSVYCTSDAVFMAYDNYAGSGGMTVFGLDKLELATGNRTWSKWYSTGATEAIHINRLFVMNDTSYLFLSHSIPTGMFTNQISTVLAKINPDGNINRSVLFQGDNIVTGVTYDYLETFPPTVTLTPYNDFVLTRSVIAGIDTALSLARIDKEGNIAWSRNYPGTKKYFPFNIQTQGKGICVMGNYPDNNPQNNSIKNNMFIIKTDSSGQITTGGGSCDRVDRPLVPVPINFSHLQSRIDSVVDFRNYTIGNGSVASSDFPIDATLVCSTPANCNVVAAIPHGTGCSLSDTLTYLLEDKADCYAAVKWKYDTAFFKLVNMNGDSIQVVPKKTGVYTIDARIEGSCMSTTQQIISAIGLSASQVTLGNDALICDRQQIKLHAGRGYTSYLWNDNSTDSVLTITQPGKYYVDVTDNCGGTGTDTVLVNAAGLVFKITGNNTKCNSDTLLLQASAGYNNYQWSPQNNLQASNNTALVSPAISTKYYATAEKWPGCQVIDSVLITTLSSPPVNLPNDASICTGDSVIVQAAPGFNAYQWNTGATGGTIIAKSTGSFIVAATFSNGCQSKDTFRLSLYLLPRPTLDKNKILCIGTTRQLQPAQNYTSYLWSDGSTGQSIDVNTTGTYWIAVTDNHGCKGSDTTQITTIAPSPADFLPADTAICQYAKLTIIAKQNYKSYLWSDFSNSADLTVKKSGLYWVTVTDQNNCTGSDSILVGSKQCMEGLYVPNAFTPNGDRQNDVFRALVFGNVTSFTFVIYNRWGGRVYETHNPAEGWDGKINAMVAQKGTYVWYCRYTLEGQPEKVEKGVVELVL